MQITIRKFAEADIPDKIRWINDAENNQYLHYDIPLEYEKTVRWFHAVKDRSDRFDAVVEVDGIAVGLIGLLGIDCVNLKAELYIALGERTYRGKGVAVSAVQLLLNKAFEDLKLNRVYIYTERDNIAARRLFEKNGFHQEGLLREDLIYRGRKVDRWLYAITAHEYATLCDTHSTDESIGQS